MIKFKVKVIRKDDFEVLIDDSLWDEVALKAYTSAFSSVDDLEELAELAAIEMVHNGDNNLTGVHIKPLRKEDYETEATKI